MQFKIDYPKPKTLWTKKYSLNRYYSGVHARIGALEKRTLIIGIYSHYQRYKV